MDEPHGAGERTVGDGPQDAGRETRLRAGGHGRVLGAVGAGHAPGATVGVLGDDDRARALGRGFLARDWEVMFGTDRPGRLSAWQRSVAGDPDVGSFADTARYGDVVVLAVDPDAVISIVESVGADAFVDALVVDATDPPETAPESLERADAPSLAERIQERLPDAGVVKCFNGLPPNQVVDPSFDGEVPRPLVCGDDPDAKARTAAILDEFGWPAARDLGDLVAARYVEALTAVQKRPAVEWRVA